MKDLMKYVVISTMISFMITNTVAMTTNNRVLLSGVLVGSALAASYYGVYNFSPLEMATLMTALLVLNAPRQLQKTEGLSCTTPGYTYDPLLGCFQLFKSPGGLTHPDANQYCAKYGGRLLLVNSEAEAKALGALLGKEGVQLVLIQGSRTSVSSPWVSDDGNPLPYTGTEEVLYQLRAAYTVMLYNANGRFQAFLSRTKMPFVCEIP